MSNRRKRMRIAVIFFGQPRNLRNPLSSLSHKWWLRGQDVDYFGHCWFSEDQSTEYTVGENVFSSQIEGQAIEILKRKYPNIRLKVEEPKIFQPSDYLLSETDRAKEYEIKGTNEFKYLPVYISQFYSINQSLKVFDKFCDKKGYDFVVLSRYDNFISYIPKPNRIILNKINLKKRDKSGFPDLLFIGSRELIGGIDVYPQLKTFLEKTNRITPEKIKEDSFLSQFPESRIHEEYFEVIAIRDSKVLRYINYFIRVRMSKIYRSILRIVKNLA